MAQRPDNTECTQDRQPELEAGFLELLGSFGADASIDDLAESLVPVVNRAKDPHGWG
ncbi:hypothetical protein BJQ90_01064 [Arthrobacter sp. SO3]|nr:hypothetical protein [Arthrobacter sp. SO3]